MDLLLDLYPTLEYDTWVLVVGRDPAKFKATRLKFENVRIILCLYHATENVKKLLAVCALQRILSVEVRMSALAINRNLM